MTQRKYRNLKRRRRLASSMTGEHTPQFPLGNANGMEASGQRCTPSVKTGGTLNTTRTSTANTSLRISSDEIAATLFKSTLLTLLASGKAKRGLDTLGNTAIVLPSSIWLDDITLRADTVGADKV